MATRSRIGIENPDGTVTSIYCHWDGYPENNGRLLVENYQDPDKVKSLIALGDISSLAEQTDCPDGHCFETPHNGHTVAYHRDRGEPFRQRTNPSVQRFLSSDVEEYSYLFTKGQWTCINGSTREEIKL